MQFHATTSKAQSMFIQNFKSLASTQTDLDKYLTIFQVNFRIFLRKFQNFPILKKNQIEQRERIFLFYFRRRKNLLPNLAFLQKIQK
jgi:hypothetical protein